MPGTWTPDGDFWRHRPVVVTGGTGFLGVHLVSQLVDLHADVVVLVRDQTPPTSLRQAWADRVSLVSGAVEDQGTIERLFGEYGVRTVFHLAAQSQVEVANRNPISTFVSNVNGTWSVLEAARRSPTVGGIILASSDKAYGNQSVLPYTEEMPLGAVYPYDVSKACGDMIARSYAETFGVPAVVTRCGNFFGPGDTNWDRLVPGTIRSVLSGENPRIRSDGTPTRDYLFVLDAALAYLGLAEAIEARPDLRGEAFNYSVEDPLSVLELVALIQEAAGTTLDPKIEGRSKHEIPHQFLSTEKARTQLGWTPRFTMREAMAQTVAWYRRELGLN